MRTFWNSFQAFETTRAKEFLLERCAAMNNYPKIKELAFAIAAYYDELGDWLPDADTDTYDLSSSYEAYLNYHNEVAEAVEYRTYLHNRVENFCTGGSSDATLKASELYLLLIKFRTDQDWQDLSLDIRLCILKIIASDSNFGNWFFHNQETVERFAVKLIELIPEGDIDGLLDGMVNSSGLLQNLWDKIGDDLIGTDNFTKFIGVLNKHALRDVNPVVEENQTIDYDKLVWNNRISLSAESVYEYSDLTVGSNGEVTFKSTLCLEEEFQATNMGYEYFCLDQEITSHSYSPFELVMISFQKELDDGDGSCTAVGDCTGRSRIYHSSGNFYGLHDP